MTIDFQEHAREFRQVFDVKSGTEDTLALAMELVKEEHAELRLAWFDYVRTNGKQKPATNFLKEMADLAYVLFQLAEERGWDLNEALRRVHASNLSKLDDNGLPVRREDGKVMKGPNYQPPSLEDLV